MASSLLLRTASAEGSMAIVCPLVLTYFLSPEA